MVLQSAEGIARFNRSMLLDVANEDESAVLLLSQNKEIVHLRNGNKSGFVNDESLPLDAPLQGFIHQQLLQSVSLGRKVLTQDLGGPGRRRTGKDEAALFFDSSNNRL
jgi:hypothetical protein